MPVGKVKWYDPERGYGFVSSPGIEDCYLGKTALPSGVTLVEAGQRVDFDFAAGRKGPQVLRLSLLDDPRNKRRPQRKYSAEELQSIISDAITLLESTVQPELVKGRFPERKNGRKISMILKAIAADLEA